MRRLTSFGLPVERSSLPKNISDFMNGVRPCGPLGMLLVRVSWARKRAARTTGKSNCRQSHMLNVRRIARLCLRDAASRNRANAVAVLFYQVIKSLRVACCGDESIAGFEYGLRNVSAKTARAAGD